MDKLKEILDEFFPQKKKEEAPEGPLDKLIADLKEHADQISNLVDSFETNKEKLGKGDTDADKSDDELEQINKEQIQYLRHALKFQIASIAKIYKKFGEELDSKKDGNKDVAPKKVDPVKEGLNEGKYDATLRIFNSGKFKGYFTISFHSEKAKSVAEKHKIDTLDSRGDPLFASKQSNLAKAEKFLSRNKLYYQTVEDR